MVVRKHEINAEQGKSGTQCGCLKLHFQSVYKKSTQRRSLAIRQLSKQTTAKNF